MQGLMQDWPMTLDRVITHARTVCPNREIVTRSVEGPIVRTTYTDLWTRSRQVSRALLEGGVQLGDRIATLAWNSARHMEVWYGAMGIGAVLHTVNPRLLPEQIAWIMNHAGDRMLAFDTTFLPIVEKIAPLLETVSFYVILTDDAHMPQTSLKNAVSYESWIAGRSTDVPWGGFDENTAAGLCYTSGTTGNPKGVLYSHRSNVLHALSMVSAEAFALSPSEVVLPIVPLFHANSWSLAFSAPMAGATMVMPGARLDGASVHEIIEATGVTCSAAVPTVWIGLLAHMEKTGTRLSTLKRVLIGGSACPRAMTETFERKYGITVVHAWGMTEMSPVGSVCFVKPELGHLEGDALYDLKMKQGYAPFMVEMKITDDAGKELPQDGKTFGRLKVRGSAVIKGYFRGEGGDVLDAEGYFDTGDVATIDPNGYMQITDRAKDVIKSGGEWISSIDLENLAMGHPDIAEAAVIGIAHPKWDERPLLVVVPKPGTTPTREAILAFMEGKIARWWMPDDVAFVEEIPHTATGKIQKMSLRDMFRDYRLPTA